MLDYKRIDAYLERNLDQSLSELSRLVAQPSVGAQNWGLPECAGLVREMLERRGFRAEVLATAGAPVVYGERGGKSPKTPLFYRVPGRGTEVVLRLRFDPPGGAIGDALARLWGMSPATLAVRALDRFKELAERSAA
jgi:hypothetical protein